jgi:hypothetical protein
MAQQGHERRWALLCAPLLAAAALLLWLRAEGARPETPGQRGGPLGLSVFAGGGAPLLLDDGGRVDASAALRFRVRAPGSCRLWLVAVDGTGDVARLHPASGDDGALVSGEAVLPGSVLLDDRPGPARIYALCSKAPLRFAEVERAVRAAAGGGQSGVRTAGPLAGLPAGTVQATQLLEKER